MKIKKNGKTINLTESDLKRIVKRVLNENVLTEHIKADILIDPDSIENKLKNKCINTWKVSPGKKGINSESDWGESWKIVDVVSPPHTRENNWGDKLTIKLNKSGDCKNSVKTSGGDDPTKDADMTATMTLVCDKQRNATSYAFNFTATGTDKEDFKDTIVYNQGVSNVIKGKEWCKSAGVEDSPGDVEDEFASTGGQSDQQMSEFRKKYGRKR
jgi:hypothetical protein